MLSTASASGRTRFKVLLSFGATNFKARGVHITLMPQQSVLSPAYLPPTHSSLPSASGETDSCAIASRCSQLATGNIPASHDFAKELGLE